MISNFIPAVSGHIVVKGHSSAEVSVESCPITIYNVSDCVLNRTKECAIFARGAFIDCHDLLVVIGHRTCSLSSCDPNGFQCILSNAAIGDYSSIVYSSISMIHQSTIKVSSYLEFSISASSAVAGHMITFMMISDALLPKFCIFRSDLDFNSKSCVVIKNQNGCPVPFELVGHYFIELTVDCQIRNPNFEVPIYIKEGPKIVSVSLDSYSSDGSLMAELSEYLPSHASVSSCQLGDVFSTCYFWMERECRAFFLLLYLEISHFASFQTIQY